MALEWEKKSNGQVGQFSFHPIAPLQPQLQPQLHFNLPLDARVRVQTQNRTLLDQSVDKASLYAALEWLKAQPRPVFNIGEEIQYVAVFLGPRSLWSGNLTQTQIVQLLSWFPCPTGTVRVGNQCVRTQFFPSNVSIPARRASFRTRGGVSTARSLAFEGDVFGLPGTLGEAGASVSVGGGLIGLAILGLAGYAIYKLAT